MSMPDSYKIAICDHLLAFESRDHAKEVMSNLKSPDIARFSTVHAKHDTTNTAQQYGVIEGITVSLERFSRPSIKAPGYRVLLTLPQIGAELLQSNDYACELVLDRTASCERSDFIIHAQPGRDIFSTLMIPNNIGCYSQRVNDTCKEFVSYFYQSVNYNADERFDDNYSQDYLEVNFETTFVNFEVALASELLFQLQKAKELVAHSNTLPSIDRIILSGSLENAVDYLKKQPGKVTLFLAIFLFFQPLYSAYLSAIEDLSKPIILDCMKTLLSIVALGT